MKITLSHENMNTILKDGWLDIRGEDGFGVYTEYGEDLNVKYVELRNSNETHRLGYASGYAASAEDFGRLTPKKPYDPSYHHNNPLCPHCQTYMIYKFECCPKCGQALDWRERE